jgi:aminoglycoside phosphotransferase (APT) family kinase protein
MTPVLQQPAAAESAFRPRNQTIEQDWGRLQSYLGRQGHTLDLRRAPRQFAGGLGNLNYLIEIDDTLYVLRRPPPGDIPPGANDMAREHRVLSVLWRRYPHAPRCLLYCPDHDVLGAHFLIMEYRPGLVIGGSLPDHLEGLAVGGRLSADLVRLLAHLHAIDPDEVGLGDFGKPKGFLERTIAGWANRARIATADNPRLVLSELADWLRRQRVPEAKPTLLHSDFKLDNVVWGPTLEPHAVLDWDMATRGDPLLDLATLLSYWSEAGDPPAMHELRQMPTAQPGFPKRSEVVAAYAAQTGLDVSDFLFHRVLAMFKLGVVFLQLYAHYRAGTTRDERYAGFENLAYGILEFTQEIARGRAF